MLASSPKIAVHFVAAPLKKFNGRHNAFVDDGAPPLKKAKKRAKTRERPPGEARRCL
jgi:transposase-like protein